MTTFVAYVRKEAGSDFGVDFPDAPGCVTAGRTLDEALIMARSALSSHRALLAELGERLPDASSMEALANDPRGADAFKVLIQIL